MMKPLRLLMTAGLLSATCAFSQCPASLSPPSVSGTSTLCAGTTGTLSASGNGDTYTWSPGGATSNSIAVSPAATATYSVIMGVTGCTITSQAAITVTVVNTPTVIASASSATACSLQTFTLSAGGASTYAWSTGSNSPTTTVTPPYTTSPPTINHTYTVMGHNACGVSSATVSVLVNSYPDMDVTPPSAEICTGEQVTLYGSSSASGSYTWTETSSQVVIATTSSVALSPAVSTSYMLESTYGGLCYGVIEITVTVDACTAVQQLSQGEAISLYPNPSNGVLHVDMPGSLTGMATLEVYDTTGRLMLAERLGALENRVDAGKLGAGAYLYKIAMKGSAVKSGRLIMQ